MSEATLFCNYTITKIHEKKVKKSRRKSIGDKKKIMSLSLTQITQIYYKDLFFCLGFVDALEQFLSSRKSLSGLLFKFKKRMNK